MLVTKRVSRIIAIAIKRARSVYVCEYTVSARYRRKKRERGSRCARSEDSLSIAMGEREYI